MFPIILRLFVAPVALLVFLFAIGVLLVKLFMRGGWAIVIAALLLVLVVAFPAGILYHHPVTVHRNDTDSVGKLSLGLSKDPGSSIWLPGIEDQFEVDVYPSKRSAIRALGLQMGQTVRQIFESETPPSKIIIFRGGYDPDLISHFGQAVSSSFPETQWIVAPETEAVQEGEVGIRLDLIKVDKHPASWQDRPASQITSGTIRATVLVADRQAATQTRYVEKLWVDNFSGFLNAHPDAHFLIARSTESCTTEAEANRQAIQNACAQLTEILIDTSGRKSIPFFGVPAKRGPSQVNSTELFEGGFIVDRFVQSFDGTAGKIWRQTLLIDTSPDRLVRLAGRKANQVRAAKVTWAGMLFSVFGLLVLIMVVYAFLNAATKGYYAWSLRIAAIVLVLIGVVSIVIFLL